LIVELFKIKKKRKENKRKEKRYDIIIKLNYKELD